MTRFSYSHKKPYPLGVRLLFWSALIAVELFGLFCILRAMKNFIFGA